MHYLTLGAVLPAFDEIYYVYARELLNTLSEAPDLGISLIRAMSINIHINKRNVIAVNINKMRYDPISFQKDFTDFPLRILYYHYLLCHNRL